MPGNYFNHTFAGVSSPKTFLSSLRDLGRPAPWARHRRTLMARGAYLPSCPWFASVTMP
jgi:hypothetical protein